MEQEKIPTINRNVKLHIPSTLSKKEFIEIALSKMSEHNMPLDAYSAIDPTKAQQYLMPAYIYTGEMEAKWSCKYLGPYNNITINKTKIEIKPGTALSSGFTGSKFEQVMTSAASDMKWAKNLRLCFKTNDVVEMDSDILREEGIIVMEFPKNGEAAWTEDGNNLTDELSKFQVMDLLTNEIYICYLLGAIDADECAKLISSGGLLSQTPTISDWEVFSRSSLTEEPKEVYIPVWYLPFEYMGEQYYLAASAANSGGYNMDCPSNNSSEYSREVNKMLSEAADVQKKIKYTKYAGCAAILVFVILSFWGAILYLGIWYGTLTFLKHKHKSLVSQVSDKLNAETENAHRKIMDSL